MLHLKEKKVIRDILEMLAPLVTEDHKDLLERMQNVSLVVLELKAKLVTLDPLE